MTYLVFRFFKKEVELGCDYTSYQRVGVFDSEGMRVMANSRYGYFMDFARFEVVCRSRMFDETIKKGVFPMLGAQKMIFKKPLKLFCKYKIRLVWEGWDGKWLYHRHIFVRKNQVYAIGLTKTGFWKNKELVNMKQLLHDSGMKTQVMKPSQEFLKMFETDRQFLKESQSLLDETA